MPFRIPCLLTGMHGQVAQELNTGGDRDGDRVYAALVTCNAGIIHANLISPGNFKVDYKGTVIVCLIKAAAA
ncbi:hypothetical protein AcV5_006916 [Taiwanofungus camphoratus]|nr:hypothetical protein AcV5_006916 [Antrodia cinnamomea]